MSQKKHQQTANSPYAVAIKYQSLSELPSVLAHGQGEIARIITEIAKANDIPIIKDENTLSTLNLNSISGKVDEGCFEVIAELFAFLYFCDEKWRSEHAFLAPLMVGVTT